MITDCPSHQTCRPQSQAFISRLPTETISDIFALVALKPPIQIRDPSDLQGIIAVSHVCKIWRDVAVNTPTLWTQIDNLNPLVTDIFIQRSKSALLELGIWLVGPFQPTINKFLPLISRAVVLDVRARRGDIVGLRTVEMILRNSPAAPSLRSFCLVGADLDHIPLPVTAFSGHTPVLRGMQVHGFTIPFESSIYRGLKRLEIDLIPGAPQMTFTQLFDILVACPDLESMDLSNAGPSLEDHFKDQCFDDIRLSHLQGVAIHNASSQAVRFLFRHIDVPTLNDLSLLCSDFVADISVLLPLETRLAIRARLSVPDIVRVTCVGSEIHFEAFEVRSHVRGGEEGKRERCAHSTFSYTVPVISPTCANPEYPTLSPMTNRWTQFSFEHSFLAHTLHFDTVPTLVIDDAHVTSTNAESNRERNIEILRLFPSIKCLKYIGSSTYCKRVVPIFLDIFSLKHDGVLQENADAKFPHLEELHLCEVALSKADESGENDSLLIPLFRSRHLDSKPIQTLTLEGCTISPSGRSLSSAEKEVLATSLRQYTTNVHMQDQRNPLRLPYKICARTD